MKPIIALVGRPNVGKSTLFNRITRSRDALVDNLPGVTRDRNSGDAVWDEQEFTLVDTGGFVAPDDDFFADQIRRQVMQAIDDADIVLQVLDGKGGLSPFDKDLIESVRAGNLSGPFVGESTGGVAAVPADTADRQRRVDIAISNCRLNGRSSSWRIKEIAGDVVLTPAKIALKELTVIGTSNGSVFAEIDKTIFNGTVVFKDRSGTDKDDRLESCDIDFDADVLKLIGRRFDNVRGSIVYDVEKKAFVSKEFTADCCGGIVIGDVELRPVIDKKIKCRLRLVFDDIEVKDFLFTELSQDAGSNGSTYGRAAGVFSVEGFLGKRNLRSAQGRLSVSAKNMKLARRSLLGKVITTMQLGDPTDFIFSEMRAEGYLKDGDLIFERIDMTGKSLSLSGGGSLNLIDKKVNLGFSAFGERIASNPTFFESLAAGIGSAMVRVQVRGDIAKPQIKTTALPMLEKPLEILGSRRN